MFPSSDVMHDVVACCIYTLHYAVRILCPVSKLCMWMQHLPESLITSAADVWGRDSWIWIAHLYGCSWENMSIAHTIFTWILDDHTCKVTPSPVHNFHYLGKYLCRICLIVLEIIQWPLFFFPDDGLGKKLSSYIMVNVVFSVKASNHT